MHDLLWCRRFTDDALFGLQTRLNIFCRQGQLKFAFRPRAFARFFAMRCCWSSVKSDCRTAESFVWCDDMSAAASGSSPGNSCWDNALNSSRESRGVSGEGVGTAAFSKGTFLNCLFMLRRSWWRVENYRNARRFFVCWRWWRGWNNE